MKKGTRVWTCDGCGKSETWRHGWKHLEGVESPSNGPTSEGLLLPLSGCSETCVAKAIDRLVCGE